MAVDAIAGRVHYNGTEADRAAYTAVRPNLIGATFYATDSGIFYLWSGAAWVALSFAYGSMWGNEIAWSQAGAVANTWYEILDANIAVGQSNRVTYGSNGRLTVAGAGKYLVNYGIVAESSVANKNVEVVAGISGVAGTNGMMHFDIVTANAEMPLAGTAILALTASQYVSLFIRTNDAGAPTLIVEHISLSVVQVGA